MQCAAAGIIGEPVICAALTTPAFGILAGPFGPSGVIATNDPGIFKALTIPSNASLPLSELDPLITFQPVSKHMREIISASL